MDREINAASLEVIENLLVAEIEGMRTEIEIATAEAGARKTMDLGNDTRSTMDTTTRDRSAGTDGEACLVTSSTSIVLLSFRWYVGGYPINILSKPKSAAFDNKRHQTSKESMTFTRLGTCSFRNFDLRPCRCPVRTTLRDINSLEHEADHVYGQPEGGIRLAMPQSCP